MSGTQEAFTEYWLNDILEIAICLKRKARMGTNPTSLTRQSASSYGDGFCMIFPPHQSPWVFRRPWGLKIKYQKEQ